MKLDQFQVLVGPNGSGKSTFLEAIDFVKSCVVGGPLKAVEQRAPEYRDLTFLRQGGPIEFDLRLRFLDTPVDLGTLHYRLALMSDELLGVRVSEELLKRLPHDSEPGTGMRLLGKRRTSENDFYRRESGTYE